MATGEITQLINQWQNGDRLSESALFEALYQQLHQAAVQCLRSERPNMSLGATGLVHEAYLRFRRSNRIEINDRHHFLALAARVMRRILVDRARMRGAARRSGHRVPEELADLAEAPSQTEADRILAVDDALGRVSVLTQRQPNWLSCGSLPVIPSRRAP